MAQIPFHTKSKLHICASKGRDGKKNTGMRGLKKRLLQAGWPGYVATEKINAFLRHTLLKNENIREKKINTSIMFYKNTLRSKLTPPATPQNTSFF